MGSKLLTHIDASPISSFDGSGSRSFGEMEVLASVCPSGAVTTA
jgi:hypothetical protein